MIEINRGDTIPASIEIYYADGDTPMDLTGRTVHFTVKERVNQPDEQALISLNSDNEDEIEIENPEGGICEWVFKSEDTKGLEPDKYYFDVKVSSSNEQYTVLYGDFIVKEAVRHSTEAE